MRLETNFVQPFDDGEDWNVAGIQRENASPEAVECIINADEGSNDGRSQWMFLRLPNGDLVLAVYPQGDTYLETEKWRSI